MKDWSEEFNHFFLQAQWGLAPSYSADLKALWASLQPQILLLASADVSVFETKDDQVLKALNLIQICFRIWCSKNPYHLVNHLKNRLISQVSWLFGQMLLDDIAKKLQSQNNKCNFL